MILHSNDEKTGLVTFSKFLEILCARERGGSDPCLADSKLTYHTILQELPGCLPELAKDGAQSKEAILIERDLPLCPQQPSYPSLRGFAQNEPT